MRVREQVDRDQFSGHNRKTDDSFRLESTVGMRPIASSQCRCHAKTQYPVRLNPLCVSLLWHVLVSKTTTPGATVCPERFQKEVRTKPRPAELQITVRVQSSSGQDHTPATQRISWAFRPRAISKSFMAGTIIATAANP